MEVAEQKHRSSPLLPEQVFPNHPHIFEQWNLGACVPPFAQPIIPLGMHKKPRRPVSSDVSHYLFGVMQIMFKRIVVIGMIALVSGCATQPVSNAAARSVPSNRIIDSALIKPSPDSGVVTVKRDSGFGGSACSSRVFVNAKPIADLDASEKVVLYLQAGEYILSAWPNGICGGGMSEVRASVKSGSELSFRIGYGSNGDFTINATAF